jgi:hypothetical protein
VVGESKTGGRIAFSVRSPTSNDSPCIGIAELDEEFWHLGMTLFALGAVSPWISMTDPVKSHRHVDLTQQLDLTTIECCHSPVIEGEYIAKAFDLVRTLPTVDAPEMPNHSILEQIVAATSLPPA